MDSTSNGSGSMSGSMSADEDVALITKNDAGSFSRRKAVSSRPIDETAATKFKPRIIAKSEDELKSLNAFLEDNCLFVHLDEEDLKSIALAMEKCTYKAGEVILEQGGKGDNFYVVGSGQVGVVINEDRVSRIREGGTFGELELMYDSPCAASIVAESDKVVVWAIDQQTYKLMVMSVSIAKQKVYEKLLERTPIFKNLTSNERLVLVDALCPAMYKDGEYLLRYGDEGEWLYVILEGVVEVFGQVTDSGEKVKVCEFSEGHHFGDLEFINNHTTVTDVVAAGSVSCVKLNRYHIELCMGTLKDFLHENIQDPVLEYYREKMLARTVKYIGRGGRRRAPVSSETYEPYDASLVVPKVEKTEAEAALLAEQLTANPLFCTFTPDELRRAVEVMARQHIAADQIVARQGEAEATFFLLQSGSCSMTVDDHEAKPLGEGQAFGEMELMFNMPCRATVKAETAVNLWTIGREAYRHVVMRMQTHKRQQAKEMLEHISMFRAYSTYQYLVLAESIRSVKEYAAGEVVVKSGDAVDNVLLILDGTLDIDEEDSATGKVTHVGQITPQTYPLLGDQEVWYTVPGYSVTVRAAAPSRVALLPPAKLTYTVSPRMWGPDAPFAADPIRQHYAAVAAQWPPRRQQKHWQRRGTGSGVSGPGQ